MNCALLSLYFPSIVGTMHRAPCILIVTYYLITKYVNMIPEEFVVG